MAIFVDKSTRLVVQGITGGAGSFHTRQMMAYGTNVVAGVTPGRAGQDFDGVPIVDTVQRAVAEHGANATAIFVPPPFAADAIMEAAAAGVALVVAITEGIPVLDMMKVNAFLKDYPGTRLIGPNCPGIISPGKCKIGIMPAHIHKEGNVGVVSRSGTLTYEAVGQLSALGMGQSTCVGIGGDPLNGTNFIDVLAAFEADAQTDAVIMIGEIGGNAEERAAAWIAEHFTKKVVAFIAGKTAPKGKRMGHAGAIISGGKGTAADKVAAFEAAGVAVAPTPADMASTLKSIL
jgi:succinyl-CoA synthetase alpha subunit